MRTIETLQHGNLKSEINIINDETKVGTSYYVINYYLKGEEYLISKTHYPRYYIGLPGAKKYAQKWINLSLNDK